MARWTPRNMQTRPRPKPPADQIKIVDRIQVSGSSGQDAIVAGSPCTASRQGQCDTEPGRRQLQIHFPAPCFAGMTNESPRGSNATRFVARLPPRKYKYPWGKQGFSHAVLILAYGRYRIATGQFRFGHGC